MADDLLAKALTRLGQRALTEAEMREWLVKREAEETEIERTIAFLTENLALDDRAYALAFTADKRDLSGWGQDRIRGDLLRRGIDRHLVEEALAADNCESEIERAVRVLKERGADLSDDRGRQRALGLLARRGYEAEEAYAAIRIAARAA